MADPSQDPVVTQQWPADRVDRRPTDSLVPDARNARTHTPEQIEQVAASIREWGWTMPVLVDPADDKIIAGHARVLAAKQIGLDTVPVIVAVKDGRPWSDEQKRAYAIADNRLAELAGWDESILSVELEALREIDFDLDLTGFTAGDLDELLEGLPAGGDAPELRASLSDRFGFVPFTVLSARDGRWQARKNAWIGLGIASELDRGAAPGGSRQPAVDPETGKIVRADSKGRPISGARTDRQADAQAFGTGSARGDGRGGTTADRIFADAAARRKGKG